MIHLLCRTTQLTKGSGFRTFSTDYFLHGQGSRFYSALFLKFGLPFIQFLLNKVTGEQCIHKVYHKRLFIIAALTILVTYSITYMYCYMEKSEKNNNNKHIYQSQPSVFLQFQPSILAGMCIFLSYPIRSSLAMKVFTPSSFILYQQYKGQVVFYICQELDLK